ncbi:huntingtin-interacting protein 1 [Mus pahari]|uniref:huntingtin-interacting protein 1 n=1 Tax=Mus pahari TaxID=10093 RepID=UPI0011147B0B|nr:huntingtin-interacting protein 1 [Mus pahari]
MDRMASSMKQVPNPLPKVLSRRGVGAGMEAAERESFERTQTVSVNKAINTQEVAVKEKHARTCILGTHHEKGAQTFWSVVNRLPLSSNAMLCWKFCHVFHKLLRDGHPNVLKDSLRYKNELSDMSRMWGHLSEGYGQLCSIYLKLLRTRMEYHTKNPRFPGNLQMSDRQLDEAGESDVNNFFQLTVEMFDYLECELNLFQTVFNSLDMSRSVSVTTAGQCRLAPLIQVILDCSHLYDYTVKLLFKLHSCLPADTLQGHRDRFMEQFTKLKDLFQRSSNLQYFKRLIQIPQLPENPPNFLRASALSEHISPVVVIPAEVSSPDSEPVLEKDDLMDMDASQQVEILARGTWPFQNRQDHLIDRLYREISGLTGQLDNMKIESQRAMLQLKGRVSELEAELAEQQHLGRQATDDCEFLRTELDELKRQREDTEKAQRSLTEIERKAQANEQRYSKLKEKYSELVQNHADLLRKNAEVTKQVSVARQAQVDLEREKKELADSFARVSDQAQRKTQEQQDVLENLKHELASSRQELQVLHSSLETSAQSEAKWLTQIAALEKEQGSLVTVAAQREEELSFLRDQLESTQIKLAGAQESMCQQVKDQRKLLLAGIRKAAEREIQEALSQLEEPALISCAGSTDHLLSKVNSVSSCLEQLEKNRSQYLACPEDMSELLHSITLLTHLTGDTIIQGSATSLRAPPEPADSLTEACRQYGRETLAYLSSLEDEGAVERADVTVLRNCLSRIKTIGEELLPRGLDIKQEELGDLVDKEMAATSAAIEAATTRIEEILSKSRAGDTGVKLEVNERILGSCTNLMQAIKVLVVASKDLQKEIVESGRGTASPKEFYAKNSRWTEGLISASKAVGWGATIMVDAADLMVQGKGKFEELMVCSREIAASTAQLVAASKVKANKGSSNLTQLQQASRGVNQATAAVVASTISGKSQIEETDNMDFSSMTLTQIKRQEMDSQVRVLELENDLQKERQKLGELRKKHYELAGVAEGWEEGTEASPSTVQEAIPDKE